MKNNYKLLVFRRSLSGFFNNLYSQYIYLYIVMLGINVAYLGLFRSIASLLSSFISSSLGFISDIFGRKKAYIIGLLLEILSIIFFAFAFNWTFCLLGLALSITSFFGLKSVENILIAESTSRESRAFGFGLISSLSITASIISPLIAAYIINMCGGISTQGIRPLFYIGLIGLVFTTVVIILFLSETYSSGESIKYTVLDAFRIVKEKKWLQKWILVETLGGYVFDLSMPFTTIYMVEIKHADEFIIGYTGTALNIASILFSPIIGKLGDKYGRVKTLAFFRIFFYISVMIFLFAPSPQYLILYGFFRGIFFASSPVFQTITMELVSRNFRGRWEGIKSLIKLIARSPASFIGGYLYYYFSPETPFITAVLVDMFIRLPLIFSMPETLYKSVK